MGAGVGMVLIAIYTRAYTRKEYVGVCVFGEGRVGKAPGLPFPGRANLLKSYDHYLD